ncbi:MAG: hypothetical protein J7M30_13150 [Deltaproteobacteria bacterium]|nr:hypothetical protein [Deltaproteobacteria bacterium]
MKTATITFMVFMLSFLITTTFSKCFGADVSQDKVTVDKLNISFLGLYLGAPISEVMDVINQSNSDMILLKKEPEGRTTTYFYCSNLRLKGAKATFLKFWDNKLQVIGVMFDGEDAEKVFDALKLKIDSKYGKMTDEIKFAGKEASLQKGSMGIQLKYKIGMVEANKTNLYAVHIGLVNAETAAEVKKKSDELGDL